MKFELRHLLGLRPWIWRLILTCGVLGLPIQVQAHDPFDGATRLLVHENTIEIEVTMGSDAVREFLKGTELPARDVARMTRANDTDVPIDLPLRVASRLYEIKAGTELLEAQRCVGLPAEGESILIVTYPRPHSESLSVRAIYFDGIRFMRTGPFTAGDEKGRLLASALLSPQNRRLKVPLAVPDDSFAAAASTPSQPSFAQFLKLGIGHILSGFDHLLFLCALLVGVRQIRPMLVVITCFTLGHSVTLALAALDLVAISSRVIEPLIAVSIIIVGLENFLRPNMTIDRYSMAAGFGLIHGFGFASALRETGLGRSGESILIPLFSFNLGVEVGQLLVAAVVVPILLFVRREPSLARYCLPVVSAAVIVISGWWLLERTLFVH